MKNFEDSLQNILFNYKIELTKELEDILDYWQKFSPDNIDGGFYGLVTNDNVPLQTANKGIVLNSRILWTFSAAANMGMTKYEPLAKRAYNYIADYFIDKKNGGVYWSTDHVGNAAETKKQIYGLAFAIYGLTEYHKFTNDYSALRMAFSLFDCIEKYSYDKMGGGYLEALSENWQPLTDLRLSAKDDNVEKTMNTHLHIIEAYANLYTITNNKELLQKIKTLLHIFDQHIINKTSGALQLYMSNDWKPTSGLQSFGHDIEASWLLHEIAVLCKDEELEKKFETHALSLAAAAQKGIAANGGIWYEYETTSATLIKEKHWWPQAEAMVGFFNAWQLNGNENHLNTSLGVWQFVKNNIKDDKNGEWLWGVDEKNAPMPETKINLWKCPYHNARACMEIIKRINLLN